MPKTYLTSHSRRNVNCIKNVIYIFYEYIYFIYSYYYTNRTTNPKTTNTQNPRSNPKPPDHRSQRSRHPKIPTLQTPTPTLKISQTQNPQITNGPTGRHQHKPQNTITRARARIPYNKKRAHVHTYAHAQD